MAPKHMKKELDMFKEHEAREMKEAHHLKNELKHMKKKDPKHESRGFKDKVKKVMHEFKEGDLHAGSKHGKRVTNRKQAVAIALSEARRKKRSR
jgi:hypothetical protein